MRVLVTGGTGLLGNNLIRRLVERGDQVRALARGSSDPRPLAGLPIEIARGELSDPAALAAAADGVECVVHAAGHVQLGWTGFDVHQRVNVEGTRRVAIAARQARARMIHVSSVDAIGLGTRERHADEDTPFGNSVACPYVVTKHRAEEVVAEEIDNGLDAVIVNPCYMIGPWDWKPSSGRMLLQVARGRGVLAPKGGNTFCDPRDVATGILLAIERGKTARRYILGGESLSYLDAWRMMAEITGGARPWFRAGPLMRVGAGVIGDLVTFMTGREPDFNSAAVRMSSLPHYFSSHRAENELGYTHRAAREAFQAAWDWFVEHGHAPPRPIA